MYGVKHCTKTHSFWREFFRPDYAVCRCRLQYPGQGGHRIPPAFHLLPQPAVLRLLGTHEAPKVAAYRHDMKSVCLEESLRPRGVLGRHDQDSLGRLWEVALRGPSHHQTIQVAPDPLEGATRPSAIRIPRMGDSGVGLPQFTD